jgi:hypothetical protein
MRAWGINVWAALAALWLQTWLALDQLANVLLCGVCNLLRAILTGAAQGIAYADETMSAHCWRSYAAGYRWGLLLMPPIDRVFGFFQKPDAEVNAAAGRVIAGHCERAFWKEVLRRNLPPVYREKR